MTASLVVFALTAAAAPEATSGNEADDPVAASFFEGSWAFAEEACGQSTNWTLRADGNFVSEDLTGVWQWSEGRLTLNLVDMAVDEETGEAGGRFQMDGPVQTSGPDAFVFIIEPDKYVLKRCK